MEEEYKQTVLVMEDQQVRIMKLEMDCAMLTEQVEEMQHALHQTSKAAGDDVRVARQRMNTRQEEAESLMCENQMLQNKLQKLQHEKESSDWMAQELEDRLRECRRQAHDYKRQLAEMQTLRTFSQEVASTPSIEKQDGYLSVILDAVEDVLQSQVRWARHASASQPTLRNIWESATAHHDYLVLPSMTPRVSTDHPTVNDILAHISGIKHVAASFATEALGRTSEDTVPAVSPIHTTGGDTPSTYHTTPSYAPPVRATYTLGTHRSDGVTVGLNHSYDVERSRINKIRSETSIQLS
ncbi:hypothetical protein AGDE_12946 [Angomonas deanei]|uniref:Uncharacterized protein n=1 Tax=Angomonas deanei TaxID=59799 RepID=A0A7G2CGU1_9TRYP|nr:hypothetical protein AGDE_12946 [Angomonas deanei]CAD2218719.1 hypothetical protein, conserved [Angomonas deanei]|eukprot:EPY23214.1 hypothetical protein AGDE_12946 [Angomonas deanei]